MAAPFDAAVFAATGVIFAACYMLWMVKRVFYGALSNPKNEGLPDLRVAPSDEREGATATAFEPIRTGSAA